MERLRAEYGGYVVYNAGFPNFPRNFSLDSLLAGIIACDPNLLWEQLCFSALLQGVTRNPRSGEEVGKIHHEHPKNTLRGLSTRFNACDTTALYLIGHQVYQELTGDESLKRGHSRNIQLALDYIVSHIDSDLFIESSEFCGATHFSLPVSY